ncbi:MAG: hypothetical protein NT061_08755 [Spirochaetes bacterium]|nr:hypothetical protein [Spirochaetota bacterium]
MKDVSQHDRGEGGSSLVYPVISRRSGGLSLGVNLFPGGKRCGFDCPYCEVAPSLSEKEFSIPGLKTEFQLFFENDYPRSWSPKVLRDICFSGNGEPTLSPSLGEALDACAEARRAYSDAAGNASILLITNSTGFLDSGVSKLLEDFASREGLAVWAKLDSGSQEGFEALSRSTFRLDDICAGIVSFARKVPIVIQTMVCSLGGRLPGRIEAEAYADRISALIESGAKIEALHFYTVARKPLEAWAEPIPAGVIAMYMGMVGGRLDPGIPLLGFDERGERPILL